MEAEGTTTIFIPFFWCLVQAPIRQKKFYKNAIKIGANMENNININSGLAQVNNCRSAFVFLGKVVIMAGASNNIRG